MIENQRTRDSLLKLLKLARHDAEILRADLADLDRARSAAELSLAEVETNVRREEARDGADPQQLAAFVEGARARRHNLRTTLMTLERSEIDLRERVAMTAGEIKKLEHLIELQDKAQLKKEGRREARHQDDLAAQKFLRG